MNELATPPGYVEYPRDPRLRDLDEIDRLEMMADAYSYFWVPALFATPIVCFGSGIHGFNGWYFGISLFVQVGIGLAVHSALIRFCRANGWNRAWALWLPLAVVFFGVLHAASLFPYMSTLTGYYIVLLACMLPAHLAVRRQFRKFDLKLPKKWSEPEIRRIVADLRSAESAPTPRIFRPPFREAE